MSRSLRRAQLVDIATRREQGLNHPEDEAIERAALADLEAEEAAAPRRVVTRRVTDIRRECLRWLWQGRIPLGKVSMLVGDPGLGKSLVTLGMAATVSHGGLWPIRGEGQAPVGDVVLVSAEDDAADTIRPRLEAAGADLSRVHVLDGIEERNEAGEEYRRPWTLADLPELEHRLDLLPQCRLLIVDPVTACLAGTDSHKNSDVRALLAPLADLAARRKVAVVVVSHLNKSQGPAIYRTTGSLAFTAAARSVYCVAKDSDDPARRILVPIKANLAPDATGVAYRINTDGTGTPRLEWEAEAFAVDANEALSREQGEERSATTDCAEWLRSELANGARSVKELQREARRIGFSDKVLRRARERLGVKSRKAEFSGGWWWELPVKRPQDAPSKTWASWGAGGIFETDL